MSGVPPGSARRVRLARRLLGAAGLALLAYGAVQLFLVVAWTDLVLLLVWMVAAVVVHDGLLSPLVLAVGAALRRLPGRGRAYVQGALVTGALVTVVALPLIHLEGGQPVEKALLLQDYGRNLAVLLGLVALVALALGAARAGRPDGARRSRANG